MEPASPKRRKRWERRWQRRRGEEFCWYLDEPPPELVKLVGEGMVPEGGALDLGCGPGVATSYLAQHFTPSVGLDIALGAVLQARERAGIDGVRPSFVVAEAPILPFRPESFSLIFDRGCLQAIPRPAWDPYFREAERLLSPGGVLQLFASKPLKRFPRLLSYRGLRARARWLLGRRGAQFLSPDLLRQLAGTMETVSIEDFRYRPRTGPPRQMIHAIFRRS
jgi:ubiquinone/menaquinone biosynthesis C-methylase UbiE